MSGPLLLDTCAVIWIATDETIGSAARSEIEEALQARVPVLASPISAWEIGLLTARGRLTLSTSPALWWSRFMTADGVAPAPMTPEILIASSFLPSMPPSDPADRIVIATARELGARVVTRDRAILAYAEAGHVAALAC